MTQITSPAPDAAVIYIPPNLSLDGFYAQECVSYVLGRGYRLAAIFRDWSAIDQMLRSGRADVVVVAREEHRVGDAAEVAGLNTVADLDRYRGTAGTRPMRQPRQYSADRVRQILDGDEAVPCGVAPETVAALRLIWWQMQDRS